jgi:hypothetical protein
VGISHVAAAPVEGARGGPYLAAQNCREGQFPESLTAFYRSHSLSKVIAVTKKREASPGLRMTAMHPDHATRQTLCRPKQNSGRSIKRS